MSLALLTDPYELTMAYGYWKLGMHERRAVFHHFFRTLPYGGDFAVTCGLQSLIDAIETFCYSSDDLDYLATQKDVDGKPLFERAFLDYLGELNLTCNIDAIPEGKFVFPHEPLVRVEGPILQAQILETLLLNLMNFQTLIATKAARIRQAAGDDQLMEFGLRRAHGPNGGLFASRAAYIGGCDSVSNVLAGKTYGIPIKGTNAHSWVMAFDDELEAFKAWAEVMPGNCVLLIDTYDSVKGIEKAIEVAKKKRVLGVRLDSGDLLSLSKLCREKLDQAGFPEIKIVASNNLDEHVIADLKAKGAKIDIWGVGTRLTTGHPQSALGGVYKLSAVQNGEGNWLFKAKRSDEPHKVSPPGVLQVRRYEQGDVIYNTLSDIEPVIGIRNDERHDFSGEQGEDLLVPIFRKGECVYTPPSIQESREITLGELSRVKKNYFVGTEINLNTLKDSLVGHSWEWDKVGYVT